MIAWLKDLIAFLNGFRKFSIMIILILVAVVFRVTGFISGAEWVDLLKNVGVAFMAVNGLEHMMSGVKDWLKGKAKSDG